MKTINKLPDFTDAPVKTVPAKSHYGTPGARVQVIRMPEAFEIALPDVLDRTECKEHVNIDPDKRPVEGVPIMKTVKKAECLYCEGTGFRTVGIAAYGGTVRGQKGDYLCRRQRDGCIYVSPGAGRKDHQGGDLGGDWNEEGEVQPTPVDPEAVADAVKAMTPEQREALKAML